MDEVLEFLLNAPPTPARQGSFDEWRRTGPEVCAAFGVPIDRALVGGFAADRPAWAFAAGYQAALEACFGERLAGRVGALGATEAGGVHPAAIQTWLARDEDGALRLGGRKTFVTFGALAEVLLIVASTGRDKAGRNRLKVVAIDGARGGVAVQPARPLPLIPEVPHGVVELDGVRVEEDEVLQGDGYDRYLKPFRTVEDLHVDAAMLGWLVGVGRRSGWAEDLIEGLLAAAAALRSLALSDPRSPCVHVALAGALAASRRAIEAIGASWELVDDETSERWTRDKALLEVASRARAARLEAAWRRLAG